MAQLDSLYLKQDFSGVCKHFPAFAKVNLSVNRLARIRTNPIQRVERVGGRAQFEENKKKMKRLYNNRSRASGVLYTLIEKIKV